RVHPVRVRLPRVHGPPAGQKRDRAGAELPPFVKDMRGNLPVPSHRSAARCCSLSRCWDLLNGCSWQRLGDEETKSRPGWTPPPRATKAPDGTTTTPRALYYPTVA